MDKTFALKNFNSAVLSGSINSDGFELGYVIEGEGFPALVIGSSSYYQKSFSEETKNIIIEIFEQSAHSPQQEEAPRFTEALLRWYNAIVFK